ncbi:protein kinase domain-containing protein [Streptomyces sp. KR80]|uniref:protein kinase domain-containing protein n=1 Tax=Streptomyces sp. KR80 TaxID=3457426 RepID=UPI003FCF5A54
MPPLRSPGTGPEAEDPEYAGRYRLEARLGSGGMGVVHLARSASGLRLAVKVVHADFAADDEFRARFRQEVTAARRVSGAFTAPVVDADLDAAQPWMATLYIPGPTLAEHVKGNGPLAPDEVKRLAAGLAEALRDIHRAGVVHRDLKPGNVLLAEDGPKVIDFGISRPSDSDLRTETGKLIGTPPFMAPEQFQRPRSVGPAADVFALGSVLVHAATGSGPFDSESPYLVAYQVVHDEADLTGVPGDLVPLIRACLAKDPADRPTPDALMELLRGEGPAAPLDARVPRPRRPSTIESGPSSAAVEEVAWANTVWEPGVGPDRAERQPRPAETAGDSQGREYEGRGAEVWGSETWDSKAGASGAEGPSSPAAPDGDRPSAARPRRKRVRWPAVAAVVAAVALGAGVAVAVQDSDRPSPAGHVERKSRATAFHPWATALADIGGPSSRSSKSPRPSRSRTPFCTYTADALHCAAVGVKAARLDPDTGKGIWSRRGAVAPADGTVPAAPVPCGGLLHIVSPDGTRLEALDPATGRTRWSKDVSAYAGGLYHAGDTVLLVSDDGGVRALEGATGEELWRRPLAGHARPVFPPYGDSRTAYAVSLSTDGSHTLVTAIDPATGDLRWKHRLSGNLTPLGRAGDGSLLLSSMDLEQRTDAIVRYDPDRRRERRIPLVFPLTSATAAVHGDTVHLLAYGGTLLAVDTRRTSARAAELWRMETSVSNTSPVTVAGDRLYFTGADGRLLAVDRHQGTLLGQTRPRMSAANRGFVAEVPAPLVADGKVFAGVPDGTVLAVGVGSPSRW